MEERIQPKGQNETAEATLQEGITSQTGRVDIADAGMGGGSGTGTFSRDQSEGMRDAPEDSNVHESQDPSGGVPYQDQAGGVPQD